MVNSAKDRRIFDRFSARFPVKLKDSPHEFGHRVFLSDISARGVRIATKENMTVNDKVVITVKLPDGKDPLDLSGQVKWVKDKNPTTWDAGLEFERINFMDTRRIFDLVEKLSISKTPY